MKTFGDSAIIFPAFLCLVHFSKQHLCNSVRRSLVLERHLQRYQWTDSALPQYWTKPRLTSVKPYNEFLSFPPPWYIFSIELMLHLSYVKQMYSQPIHLIHEFMYCVCKSQQEDFVVKSLSWHRVSHLQHYDPDLLCFADVPYLQDLAVYI